MKKILLLVAAMALCASSAFAVGVDLSVNACPGGAGVANDAGALDCAGGALLSLNGVFQPNEALPDMNGIDIVFDIGIAGDIHSNATFWDFANANSAALNGSQTRSTGAGCNTYNAAWSPSGSGAGTLGVDMGQPNRMRVVALCYRPSGLAVTANQKIWGIALTIDASTSAEFNGGSGPSGCSMGANVTLNQIIPRTVSGNDGSALTSQSLFGQSVNVNGGTTPVPTAKHTWGQLKSMYR